MTIGCLSIILGAVAIILYFTGRPLYGYRPYYYNPTVSYIGAGIWSGIFVSLFSLIVVYSITCIENGINY